jgi:hypothetical protein
MNVILTQEEANADALRQLVIRDRTGELGILHGMDRFVATAVILKKPERELLNAGARKIGLAGGIPAVRK